jgi:hypothetical protein
MSNVPKTIDQLLNDYAQAWRGDGNGTTAETFPDPLQQRVEELEAALRPFANVYHNWQELTDPESPDRVSGLSMDEIAPLTLAPYKAAARALGES